MMRTHIKRRAADIAGAGASFDLAVEVWQRRRWLAIGVFVLVAVGAITAAWSLPDLYRSTSTVLVARQQVSEAFVRASVTAELETRIQTIHQEIMSRARLTGVITRLNLYPDLRGDLPLDAIVERMRRDIQLELKGVEQMAGRAATIAFAVSYTGRDPQKVAEVANTLAALYVEENTRSRERQAHRTAAFLKEQLDSITRELDAQQRRVAEFRLRHTAELPQQLEANLAALERLNSQLRLNGEYQLRAVERGERLERQLGEAKRRPADAPAVPKPLADLAAKRQELAQLRRQYSGRHPDVIRVIAEIETLEERTTGLETPPAEPSAEDSVERIEQHVARSVAELAALREEERFLRTTIREYEARVETAPKRAQELQELSRDQETTKERHDAVLRQYEAAQLAATLEERQNIEQFRVLDPAIAPVRPSAPNRLWLIVMGLVAAAGLGFGAMLAMERLDTSFHTADDLRAFAGVPMVATVRLIRTPADVRQERRRAGLVVAALVVAVGIVAAGSYYIAGNNEQLVRLATRSRS
jgi:polysaccharide chain length determinant protein (PEP-CTERM system associated)